MATVREFVVSKLASFGLELSPVEIDALLIDASVSGGVEYSTTTAKDAKKAIAKAIPELLLKPDITEGGYSVKWDKAGLKTYYSLLCSELGLTDSLSSAPTIRDKSYVW